MPKLAIYIPKPEMREVEQWRKQLNFSQIFMNALRREIRDRSRVPEAAAGQLARAAEFYRKSLEEDAGALIDAGYQLGCSRVLDCQLAVSVIRKLLAMDTSQQLSAEDVQGVCETFGGDKALQKFAQKHHVQTRTVPTWREMFCRGFVKGVTDAWEQVCEEMHAHSD